MSYTLPCYIPSASESLPNYAYVPTGHSLPIRDAQLLKKWPQHNYQLFLQHQALQQESADI